MAKNKVSTCSDKYIHTGGYDRLAGHSLAPGSRHPSGYYNTRRVCFVLVVIILFAMSLYFVLR